ncbi:hypothetical protein Mal64_26150 [Pseudobythopirellula maris]|uniref:Uncharacterized protein n=1 Tax=Pseudobythopirellula maris TaxID=2527991 RepID=A0A5C5ZSD6_9BACT|nr:hypothetical protein [Pseudobythopirellula maris]TWT89123.1 hypothetical protein Mal64_26150 [Pseudobythopirellula maris]
MKIDLRVDAKTVFDFIKERVTDYPVYVNNGPGEDDDPISQITLGFQVSQAGWVALVFDTRPDGSPDGEWQSYIEENWLEFPHWLAAVDALFDNGESIELILQNGKRRKLGEDDELAEPVGQMLKDILLQGRKERLFKQLPLAKRCSIGVEDHDGAYGWPAYDKRYKDGRPV